jgi:hypothetical protein
MRVPQVNDRLKEAPAQALRAVFSGVGTVLLVADRLRHRPSQEAGQGNGHATRRATAQEGSSPAATAPPRQGGSPATQGGPAAKAASPAKASSAKASSVKARAAAPPAPRTPAAPPTSADSPAPVKSGGRPAKATAPAPARSGGGSATAVLGGVASGSGVSDGLPIAGYDGLSMPQLRARMRTLDPAQLRALIAHERAHAGRDEVVAMFERRIAKVEGGE